MNRYKININRTPPGPEDIKKLRNFDYVLRNAADKVVPFYKNLWFITSAAAILIIGLVSTLFYIGRKQENKIADTIPFIQTTPIDFKYDIYELNCDDSATLTTKSGTRIHIPKGSLTDSMGNIITGNVKVKYREFKDPADFICSGIPMTYDSAGTNYYFESAGMFDLLAFQNNSTLQVSNGKNISVEMESKFNANEFNQYYLDTMNKQWVYQGVAQVKEPEKKKAPKANPNLIAGSDTCTYETVTVPNNFEDTLTAKNEVVAIQKSRPVPPVKANSKKTHFNFNYDLKDFPELAAYKDVLFDVGDENKNFKEAYYDMTWENVQIEEGPRKGVNFRMTLTRRNQKVVLIVYPVFDAKNYEAAKVQYAKLMEDYKQKLDVKNKEIAKMRDEAKIAFEMQQKEVEQKSAEAREQQRKVAKAEEERFNQAQQAALDKNTNGSGDKFWFIVSVNRMGIWNNDCPHRIENKRTVYTTCADEENKNFSPLGDVYLIDKTRNACIGYHPNSFNETSSYSIDYNASAKNILVTFKDNNIAIVDEEDFERYTSGNTKATMNFKVIEGKNSVQELRELLKL